MDMAFALAKLKVYSEFLCVSTVFQALYISVNDAMKMQ